MRKYFFILLLICFGCLLWSCSTGSDSTLDNRGGNSNGTTEDDDDNDNAPLDDDDDDNDNDDNDDNDDDSTYPPYEGDLALLIVDPRFNAEPVGYHVQYSAVGKTTDGEIISEGIYPIWESSDETIATIENDGEATTVANGESIITAKWHNSDNTEVQGKGTLYVTGDVFALDQANGNIVQIDIAKKKIRPQYIIGLTPGAAIDMAINSDFFMAILIDGQPTGAIDYAILDIDNPLYLNTLDLYENHRGVQAIRNRINQMVYIAEPTTNSLTLFNQDPNEPYISSLAGLLLLRDDAHPVSLIDWNQQSLVVLADNSSDRTRTTNSASLYFFSRDTNALSRMVLVNITNPKQIGSATDGSGNTYIATLGGLNDTAGPTHLDIWDETGEKVQGATIATAVDFMATDYCNEVWLGDADQPRLYVYGTEEADWIRGLNNPLILPSGSAVTAMEMNVSRREVWVANDDGTIFLYGLDSYELKDTYECDGCGIVDLAIW